MKTFNFILLLLVLFSIIALDIGHAENQNAIEDTTKQKKEPTKKAEKLEKDYSLLRDFKAYSSEITAISTSMGHSPVFGLQ